MRWLPSPLAVYAAVALLSTGCTQWMTGVAVHGPDGPTPGTLTADRVLLSQEKMQAITGAGTDLTIIPGMNTTSPIDDEGLAVTVPSECRFMFAETAIFGTDFTDFRKTVFQYPPRGALISEAAAVYPDPGAAQQAFDAFADSLTACGNRSSAALLGEWSVGPDRARTRPRDCGRDYRLKGVVLFEVVSCGLPASVADIVIANMADHTG